MPVKSLAGRFAPRTWSMDSNPRTHGSDVRRHSQPPVSMTPLIRIAAEKRPGKLLPLFNSVVICVLNLCTRTEDSEDPSFGFWSEG